MPILEFGEWMPDLPDLGNPGTRNAQNVYPARTSYRPFKGLTVQSNNAIDARCRGLFSAKTSAGNTFVYAGNETKLYELVDNAWVDESKGGGYSTADADGWEFTLFGTTAGVFSVIATNFTDPVQSIAVGGGGAGAFADLITSTNVPKAKHMDTVGNFLMLGNTTDATDGDVPSRVWWSGINDATDFDPDATTQSDFQTFKSGGAVQRVVGGAEYVVIFQEEKIVRGEYVGSPLVFDFDDVDRERGTPIPNSVVAHGRNVYYITYDGFFVFDGVQSRPIGAGKVDRTFWNEFDLGNRKFVSAAIDAVNKVVMWSVPGTGSAAGQPNKLYLYNWVFDKWSEVLIEVECLGRVSTQGFTLDGLDALGTDIDDSAVFSESFDSEVYRITDLRIVAIDTDNKLANFTGSTLAATIDTSEGQLFPGKKAMVNGFRPLITSNGGSPTITGKLAGRDLQTDSVTFGSSTAINSNGEIRIRDRNRYHRAQVTIAAGADWDHAQGVEFEEGRQVVPAGDR